MDPRLEDPEWRARVGFDNIDPRPGKKRKPKENISLEIDKAVGLR